MGFYGFPLNPISLTCGVITFEATPGKEPGKERNVFRETVLKLFGFGFISLCGHCQSFGRER